MLQSHLHSLIAKAHRYQEEPERFERTSTGSEPLRVTVHGANPLEGQKVAPVDDAKLPARN